MKRAIEKRWGPAPAMVLKKEEGNHQDEKKHQEE